MLACWDCGMRFKSRENDGEVEVYDPDNHSWVIECPNCGCMDFIDENSVDYDDFVNDDDYDDDDDY